MNREIKFRGKRIDNSEWVYGCYVEEFKDRPTESPALIITPNQSYDVISETVGQYTGLKDKNGKEIYEGDIIVCTGENDFGRTPSVVVIEPILGFGVRLINGENKGCWNGRMETWMNHRPKVIGNIHQNPELIKET